MLSDSAVVYMCGEVCHVRQQVHGDPVPLVCMSALGLFESCDCTEADVLGKGSATGVSRVSCNSHCPKPAKIGDN